MQFDLTKKHRLVLSDLQYAVARMFYNEGPGYVMPVENVLRLPGGTLNSLLDPRGKILEETRDHGLRMTKDGYNYMTRFEGRDPFKENYSRRFCAQMRLNKGFKQAAQLQLIKKVTEGAEQVKHPRGTQPASKLFRVPPAVSKARSGSNGHAMAAAAGSAG